MDKSMFNGFFRAMIVVAVLAAIAGIILWEFVVWMYQHIGITWK